MCRRPGGVDEQVIRLARLGGGDGVVRHGGGIGAVGAGDDFDLEPLAPELDLLDGGGAEGVARGEQHGLAPAPGQVGQLGGGGGLAGAVDADDGDDGGAAGGFAQARRCLTERLFSTSAPGDGEDVQAARPCDFVGLLDRRDDLRGHGHAEIGGDQRGFQFLEGLAVQPGRAGDDALDFVGELAVRLLQAGFEFGEKSHVGYCGIRVRNAELFYRCHGAFRSAAGFAALSFSTCSIGQLARCRSAVCPCSGRGNPSRR